MTRGLVTGRSEAMRELLGAVERVARRPWPVLIVGETGTGKELVARRLHDLSPRSRGPFVAINVAALVSRVLRITATAGLLVLGVAVSARAGADQWCAVGSMTVPRQGHTMTLVPSGKVLGVGGGSGGPPLASAELFDPVSRTFTATASMPEARISHTATLLPPPRGLARRARSATRRTGARARPGHGGSTK